ncbi:MAG: response regulator [Anaerolineae bacterium]
MSNNPTILVIDDDAMNREVMEAFLSSENYVVLLASNGKTGIDMANNNQPQVIVLDVRMPDMSGFEVCAYLKGQAQTRHIPIMIVTGFDDREDFEKGQSVGANDFITRPFDGDDLLRRVRQLISN